MKNMSIVKKTEVLGTETMISNYISEGNIFREELNYKAAIDSYSMALEYDPQNVQGLLNLGRSFFLMGQRKNAIEMFEKAYNIDPDNHDVCVWLGTAYLSNFQSSEATKMLIRARNLRK